VVAGEGAHGDCQLQEIFDSNPIALKKN